MDAIEVTVAERGQIVIPKSARDALGLKPGSRLQIRVIDGKLVIEKRVQLDLSKWIGSAIDDGMTTDEALAELRGRPVPWPGGSLAEMDAAAPRREGHASVKRSATRRRA